MKFFLLFALSFNLYAQKVFLFKQWHLTPKVSTLDIGLSTKLAQYENQHDLYLKTKEVVANNNKVILLAEGCEKLEINEKFGLKFNEWRYGTLDKMKSKPEYEKILTLLPLKIEVELKDKVATFCADNEKLIKETQLALSDIRAYVGFNQRLKEFKDKGDQVSFDRYAKSLSENTNNIDPVVFAKEQALKAIATFEKLNAKREEYFVAYIENLKLQKDQVAILIVGGVHVDSINKKLTAKGVTTEIYIPKGYVETDKDLIGQLKEKL